MSVPVWPTTLPVELLMRGYNQTAADVTLRSSVDAGPAKIRRRFTAGVQPITGNLILSGTELGYLRTFFDTTLLGGSLRFTWREPVTLVSKEFRFTAPLKWTCDNGYYDVSLELEMLP